MKLIFLISLTACVFTTIHGLKCFQCTNARRNIDCKSIVTCSWGSLGCENEIRLQNNQIYISKHCKQYNACKANLKNNYGQCNPRTLLKAARSGVHLEPSQTSSFCRSCCKGNLCNRKPFTELSVATSKKKGIGRHRMLLPPIADVESILTSPTSALITFTDPSDTPGASYYITLTPSERVEITAVRGSEIPNVKFNDTVPENVIAYIATGLSGGTRYKVNIIKKVGFSRFAQGIFDTFVTNPMPLQGLEATEYNTDSVVIDVGKPQVYKSDKFDSIHVAYRKASDPEENEQRYPPFTRPQKIRLTDLEPSTEYFISVWTSLDGPDGNPNFLSDRVNLTVFTKVPSVMETVLLNHHATNLTWMFKTSHKGVKRTQKEFVVTVRDDTDGIFIAEKILGGAKRTFTMTNLIPENYYTFTVKAKTDGRYSEVVRHAPVRTVTRCYGCIEATSRNECMEIVECAPESRGCLVELRSRSYGKSAFSRRSFRATMKCKQVTACDKQEDQNLSDQCDPTNRRKRNVSPPEVCRCCCEGDLCDGPGTECGKLLGWLDPVADKPITTQTPAVLCKKLQAPRDGKISCTEGQNTLGTKCKFTCDSGTYLLGIGETECLPGGTWSHRNPVCRQAKKCPPIETTFSLYAKCTRFNRPFSKCQINCRPGFIRFGRSTVVCKPTGLWTTSNTRCVQRDECQPNPCVNGARCQDFVNDFECHCRPGFYGELCERERVCEALVQPDNGILQCTLGNKFGSRCRYNCDPGYSMHGPKYTKCDRTGLWTGGDPTMCVVNKCKVIPQNIVNGGKSDCTGYAYNDTCTFTCPRGLRIAGGPSEITCGMDSKWTNDLPCCDLPCPPYAKVDVILVLDSSSSVGKPSWKELIKFTAALLDRFVIGKRDMRVGVLRYNKRVDRKSEIDMGDYRNLEDLKRKIRKIPYNGGGTKTGKALQHVFDHSIKVPGNRPGVPDIVIVITDGLASDSVKPPADALKRTGAKIYVVGVINKADIVNVKQLEKMASGPKYLQIIDDGYAKLVEKLTQQLVADVCWLPCKFKYEQRELIERNRMRASARIERQEEKYWEQFDNGHNKTKNPFPAVQAGVSVPKRKIGSPIKKSAGV
ncbi:uncharacterized protein LOC120333884 [Styela clava]